MTPPIKHSRDTDIFDFLAEQEIDAVQKDSSEDTFNDAARDMIRFLEIALEDATQDLTLFPLPNPDPRYHNARIFHHYFTAYRHSLVTQVPLTEIPDCQIVEFILEEFEKFPISEPLTFEQAEKQAVKLGIIRFLTSPQGQRFLSSKYVQCCVSPMRLKTQNSARDHWTFILLYWRFKRHWKGRAPIESVSVMQIAEFLSRHYMNYWRHGLGTDTDINVFSVQLPATLTPKNSEKIPVVSDSGKVISKDFSRFNTPSQAQVSMTSPPPLAKIPRIMTNEMLAQLDSTNQTPSTPSRLSHAKTECIICTRPNPDHQRRHCSEDDAYMKDDDKENFPPAPLKNGETSEQTARFLFPENNIPTDRAKANTENYAIDRRLSHVPLGTASAAQMRQNSSQTSDEGLTEQGIIWNKINREKYEFNRYKSPGICAENPGGKSSANMEQPPEFLFHPHNPISDPRQIRNLRIVEDLRPAAFSLTCPDGCVTEIFFNSS